MWFSREIFASWRQEKKGTKTQLRTKKEGLGPPKEKLIKTNKPKKKNLWPPPPKKKTWNYNQNTQTWFSKQQQEVKQELREEKWKQNPNKKE